MKRILGIFALSGCGFLGSAGSISVINNTGQTIDSLVIVANGYNVTFYEIPVNKTIRKDIAGGIIKGSHHIKMWPTIYQNGKAIKGQYLYNDLSGFSGNYTISIDSTSNVKWSLKD